MIELLSNPVDKTELLPIVNYVHYSHVRLLQFENTAY